MWSLQNSGHFYYIEVIKYLSHFLVLLDNAEIIRLIFDTSTLLFLGIFPGSFTLSSPEGLLKFLFYILISIQDEIRQ